MHPPCAPGVMGHLIPLARVMVTPFINWTTMDLTTILIQVISGVVGGNVGGLLNKAKSLGPLLNTILGAIGGVGGGQLLGGALTSMLGNATAGEVTSSGLVGLLIPLIGGMLKKKG